MGRWRAPASAAGTDLPLAIRIVQVARDAHFQRQLRGPAGAVAVVRQRADGAFDPAVVDALDADMLEESADWAEPWPPNRPRT